MINISKILNSKNFKAFLKDSEVGLKFSIYIFIFQISIRYLEQCLSIILSQFI